MRINSLVLMLVAVFLSCGCEDPADHGRAGDQEAILYWTCGMHPSVRVSPEEYEKSRPKCPICNMDLVPVRKEATEKEGVSPTLTLSSHAEQLAGVRTEEVAYRELFKEILTVGTIDFDERNVASVSAWVGGRIDKLYVDFTGTKVRRGQPLALIYSPKLISTQEEYLLALETLDNIKNSHIPEVVENARSLVESAKRRLLLWGVPDEEIERLKQEQKPDILMAIHSPIDGTVVKKSVLEGDYVNEGEHLYTVADLTDLWMIADIYEYEMAWITLGQNVKVTTPAYPGETFGGTITFIDPVLHSETRSMKIRCDFPNPHGKLKPGMFVTARIGIPLTKAIFPRGSFEKGEQRVLAIPSSSLLDTGKRQVVYVSMGDGNYQIREVKIGPQAGEYYPLLEGVWEGEMVVVRANFLIDSQTELTGPAAAMYDAAIGETRGH